jgi:hypothetical protein
MKLVYIILTIVFGLATIDGLISAISAILSLQILSALIYSALTYLGYIITRKCADSI